MMDIFDDRLDEAARALGDQLPALDAALDDAVMAEIRTLGAPGGVPATPVRRRRMAWLLEPRRIEVRPVWVALAAAAVLALLVMPRGIREPGPDNGQTAHADTMYVHFALTAPEAREVAVAGSFNGWDTAALHLRRATDGTWEATVPLPVGEHRYQFVVDGVRWVADPSAQSQMDDGFGGTNSVIVVGPKGVVRS